MKEFVIDFLKVFSNSILIVCFAFSAFLLIINFYHHEDISRKYDSNIEEDIRYIEYKESLKKTTKKMNSVSSLDPNYDAYGKVIKDNYDACIKKLDKSLYNNLGDNDLFNSKMVYDLNYEIINEINNVCLVAIPSFINRSLDDVKFDNDVSQTIEMFTAKRDMIQENADYLMGCMLSNSSYSFSTDIFKTTVYDKNVAEFDLTVDNYTMIASSLDDLADWYVLEFGGNN